eukprot:TRINITY_DN5278_c0_g3_i1.p3 TRINITY_DN5278_c0_g3~~TRINITY_DN5278_c0_g3_i1.p3  ORF type:complete len:105 (+),score=44.92 TRINITY_DN5278_c0_g3_i1:162-476(+)
MSQLTANHQEYIQSKVNPILESVVTQVLMERPDNPVPFMIRWLAEQTKAPSAVLDVGEAEALKAEMQQLQLEIKDLEAKVAAIPTGGAASSSAAPAEEEEEEEE